MKRNYITLLVFLLLFPTLFSLNFSKARAGEYEQKIAELAARIVYGAKYKPVQRVTVLNFIESPSGIYRPFSRIFELDLTQKLIQNLDKTFRVVEIHQQVILEQLRRQIDDIYDPEKRAQFGRLSGADAIITGTYMKWEKSLKIYAQLISVNTGQVLYGSEIWIPIKCLSSESIESLGIEPATQEEIFRPEKPFFLNSPPLFGMVYFERSRPTYMRSFAALKLPSFVPSVFGFSRRTSRPTSICVAVGYYREKPWQEILADFPGYKNVDLDIKWAVTKTHVLFFFKKSFPMFFGYRANKIHYLQGTRYFYNKTQKLSVGIGFPMEQSFFPPRYTNKTTLESLYIEADAYRFFSGIYGGFKFSLSRFLSPFVDAKYSGYVWNLSFPKLEDGNITHQRLLEVNVGTDVKIFQRIRGFVGYRYQEYHLVSASNIEKSNRDSVANEAVIFHTLERSMLFFGALLSF